MGHAAFRQFSGEATPLYPTCILIIINNSARQDTVRIHGLPGSFSWDVTNHIVDLHFNHVRPPLKYLRYIMHV